MWSRWSYVRTKHVQNTVSDTVRLLPGRARVRAGADPAQVAPAQRAKRSQRRDARRTEVRGRGRGQGRRTAGAGAAGPHGTEFVLAAESPSCGGAPGRLEH